MKGGDVLGLFKRNKINTKPEVKSVPQSYCTDYLKTYVNKNLTLSEMRLYEDLKNNIPIIDAAICKTAKLIGGCKIKCKDKKLEKLINEFILNIKVNGCSYGLESFLSIYMEQMLTYGTAIGEIVINENNQIYALYNVPLENVEIKEKDSPLNVEIYAKGSYGKLKPVLYPELILLTALSPSPGAITGESILKGLSFVSEMLIKIYSTIGKNWERVGNVRYAVTYKPPGDTTSKAYTAQRAKTIANEWQKAMSSDIGSVSDFICVGDVDIKVIGADNQILDSEVPVKQLLEQILAKLSIPPFLLGISWSTTERMASEQLDIFTSELNSYRRMLTPIVSKICSLFLRTQGFNTQFEVIWDDIALKDLLDAANARLQNARAKQIEETLGSNNIKED